MSDPKPGVVSSRSDADGIEIVVVFEAPRRLVYEAWTTPVDVRMETLGGTVFRRL